MFFIKLISFITTLLPLQLYMTLRIFFEDSSTELVGSICLSLMLMNIILIAYLIYYFKIKIKTINENNEIIETLSLNKDRRLTLDYLATNIFPILAFQNGEAPNLVFTAVIVLFMGVLYIKNDLFYINPIYDLFGILVYMANVSVTFSDGSNSIRENVIVVFPNGIYAKNKELQTVKFKNIYLVKRDTS